MSITGPGNNFNSNNQAELVQPLASNAHAIVTGRIFLKGLSEPHTVQMLQAEQVKPLSQAEAAVQKAVRKVDKALKKWHQEWTEPLELTGKPVVIDFSLKNYVSVLHSVKELLLLYNKETAKLDDVLKLKIVTQMRAELKQIQHTQSDFVHEQLSMVHSKVTEARKAFEIAKTKLLKTKDNFRALTKNYRGFREAVAKMRQVERQCQEMTAALIEIQTALSEDLLPKPAKKGWFQSLKELAKPPKLFPTAKEQLEMDTERLHQEYHTLRQAVENDTKTVSQLVTKSAIKGTDIARCNAHFTEYLDTLDDQGKALVVLLKKPFTERHGKLFDRTQQQDYLDGKRALAFILAVEEQLPQDASKELRLHVSSAKKTALTALHLEGALPSSADTLYASILDEEYAHEFAAFHQEFQKQEVALLTQLEAGSSASRIQALNLFFLALHAFDGAHSFLKMQDQAALLPQKAARMKKAIEESIPKQVQKAASFIGTALQDKFQTLKKMNDAQFLAFTKKYPETRAVLSSYRTREKENQPTQDEVFALMSAFQWSMIPHQVNPFSYKSVADWMELFLGSSKPQAAVTRVATQPTVALLQRPVKPIVLEHTIQPSPALTHNLQTSAATRTHQQFILFSLMSGLFGAVKGPLDSEIESSQGVSRTVAAAPLEYGNKHRRLVELHEMVSRFGIEDVTVPMPYGVASQHVEKFLLSQNRDLFTVWDVLKTRFETFLKEGKNAAHFLEEEDVAAALGKVQKEITDIFEKAANNPEILDQFVDIQELQKWLDDLNAQGKYLMVRSTGREDTNVANAGGNLSMSYVSPTFKDVLMSMGNVVASYFSAPSLQNLILAKQNPFEATPPLAVTLQELIGEPVGGTQDPQSIPVSCVLFSNEPYYTGTQLGNAFRALRISCGFGHGEAVVTSQGIATDTVIVLQSKTNPDDLWMSYNNQPKPQRLAPQRATAGNVDLVPLDNPPTLVFERAMNPSLIRKLWNLGVALEKAFSFPVDSELVVKNNIIYVVQARPINRKEAVPTYVDAEAGQTSITQTIQAKVVVPGLASALLIRSPDRVLIANNLETLEKQKKYNENEHDLIIISTDAPANSHAVVNFSGLGVPVLYTTNIEAVQKLVRKAGKEQRAIAVCMQEGVLYLVDEAIASADSLIQPGYVEHPATLRTSLAVSQPPTLQGHVKLFIPPDFSSLLRTIRTAKTTQAALQALQKLKEHPFIASLSRERLKLEERIVHLNRRFGEPATYEARLVLNTARELELETTKALQELEAALSSKETPRLERLLKAKIVKVLLTSEVSAGAISSFSHVSMQEAFAAADLALSYQEALPQPAMLTEQTPLLKHAIGAAQEKEWIQFLTEIEKSCDPKQLTQFKKLLQRLDAVGVISLWMNLIFAPSQQSAKKENNLFWNKLTYLITGKQPSTVQEVVKNLLDQDTPAARCFLDEMIKRKTELASLKSMLTLFQDEKNFTAAFNAFKKMAAAYNSTQFIDSYITASPVGRLAVIQEMSEVIDLYDSAIKKMTGSFSIDPRTRVRLFKEMLSPYFKILENWVLGLPVGKIPFAEDHGYNLAGYLHTMKVVFNEYDVSDTRLLESTGTFSVDAAMLGGAGAFLHHLPKSYEDFFTLVHQNLLFCLSGLSNAIITTDTIKQLALPRPLFDFLDKIDSFRPGVRRIGVSITASQLILCYNIPLRQHSAKMFITYEEVSEEVSIRLQLLGVAAVGDRWNATANYVRAMEMIGKLTVLEKCEAQPQIVEVVVALPQESATQNEFLRRLNGILDYSTSGETLFSITDSEIELINQNIKVLPNRYVIALIEFSDNYVPSQALVSRLCVDPDPEILEKVASVVFPRLGKKLLPLPQEFEFDQELIASIIKLIRNVSQSGQIDVMLKGFLGLLKKGVAVEGIAAITLELMNDDNRNIRTNIFSYLLPRLVDKGVAIEKIAVSALKLIDDIDDIGLSKVIIYVLLPKILDTGIAVEEITAAAQKLTKHKNENIREMVIEFLLPRLKINL